MTAALQDIDYLYSSSRLRCLEKNLLNRERLERMCEAKSNEDAVKVLEECGYHDFPFGALVEMEIALSRERKDYLDLLESISPDKRLIDIFKIKFDYHNVKAIIKGDQAAADYDYLLSSCGRFETARLKECLRESSFAGMPPLFRQAVTEAKETLGRTGDPQLADFVLDKGCYGEMLDLAVKIEGKFLIAYVKLLIDCANLRASVRARRMGKSLDFLRQCLIPGGEISVNRFNGEISPDFLENLYRASYLAKAAEGGAAALRGENSLSAIDLLCDNTLNAYLKDAKYIAFGAQPLIAFAAAKEAEITSIRTIMAGRFGGLSSDTIKERLRETYV